MKMMSLSHKSLLKMLITTFSAIFRLMMSKGIDRGVQVVATPITALTPTNHSPEKPLETAGISS